MPARMYKLSMLVDFRHPVIHLQLSFRAGSSFLAWVDLSHTGQAYSAVEKLRARAVERSVFGHAPHLVLVSLRRMLLREPTFAFVFKI